MSGYFDHVRCHNCNAHIEPERIEKIRGKMACPACGEDLKMTDLFGVKASFLEDDSPHVTMDDLVPGQDGHFENPWGAPAASEASQGAYQWATEEEKAAHAANLRGAPAEQGERRDAPPVRSVGLGGGAPPPKAKREIPAGAVRARHIDPPASSEGRYSDPVPTPEPAPVRRRRFGGPNDAKPEDNALVRVASEDDDVPAEGSDGKSGDADNSLDKLREMKEKRKKKRRRF